MDNSIYTQKGLRWRDVRTGVVVTLGIGIMAWLALVIGENNGMFAGVESVTFFATDVKGLVEGNQVTISGKKVGTVDHIELAERGDTTGVRVTLGLRREYIHILTTRSKAVVRSLGVLGDKYVDIMRAPGDPLLPGAEIAISTEPGFEELTTSGLRVLNRVDSLGLELATMAGRINQGEGTLGRLLRSNDIADRVDDLLRRTDGTIASLRQTVDRLRDGKGVVPRLLNDPTLAVRVADVVSTLSAFTSDLRDRKGTLGRLMADDTLYATVVSVARRMDALARKLGDSDGTLSRLTSDPALYDNINRNLLSLDSLVRDIKSNPGRYVRVTVF